jgi:uncharacterized protein YecE (DUF72 family)
VQVARATIGCSGWNYRDWRGLVYPPTLPVSKWFALYATWFDSVELNTTFYRMPPHSTFEAWAAKAPAGFTFAVKVGAFGTHRKKLIDAATWLPNHIERVRLLGDHLGPNLVQLPPRWKRNAARLDEMLSVAPSDLRWAVELRDRSWLHDDVFEVLRRHGAALCLHDLLADHPIVLTTDWTYVRFHGPDAVNHPYRFRYGPRVLSPWARRMAGWLHDGVDVWAYFNNDYEGNAIADARTLRGQVSRLEAGG